MQCFRNYNIKDLVDKSKRIVIISIYNNEVIFDGKYDDVPEYFLDANMRIFTPYEDRFEFKI